MQLNTELDSLIEKYKSELIKLSAQYGGESAADSETDDSREASLHSEEVYTQEQEVLKDEYGHSDGNLYSREDEAQMPEEISDDFVSASEEKEASPNPVAQPENYATFKAVVLSAGGAFPVPDAKVSLKRKGELHAFLVTNGSGETKTVKIEAYPEENSLEPLNPDKQMFYTADIKADGFEDKTDLPVYATGGSQIILQEYLVPTGGM